MIGGEAERHAIVDGHAHDGVDTIDIQPVADQENQRGAQLAYFAEGRGQLSIARSKSLPASLGVGGCRFLDPQQKRHRENRPPQRDHYKAHPHRLGGVCEAKGFRVENHRDIDREEQTAAQITQTITQRRDKVGAIAIGDFDQQGIVEGVRSREAHRCQYVDTDRQHPLAFGHQIQATRGEDAEEGEGE